MLTEADVNGDDSMNYAAVEKFIDVRVENLLSAEVPGSDGTILYLKIIRSAVSAFTEPSMEVSQRIYHIWYATFLLRGWKEWIQTQSNLTMENFVTTSAYTCIELNAHALIQLVNKTKDQPELCLPSLCNSQHCESFFRFLRSMTSSLCTVVNFSVLDVLNRIRRVALEEELSFDLKEKFTMPHKNIQLIPPSQLPDLVEINEIVENARTKAISDLKGVGITSNCYAFQLTGNIEETTDDHLADKSEVIQSEADIDIDNDVIDDLKLIISNCPNALNIPHIEKLSGEFKLFKNATMI
jgi:hypothetical protein